MEPKKIVRTYFSCPGCKFQSKKRYVIVDHLTRCWHNPDVRACSSCVYFNQEWEQGVSIASCSQGYYDLPRTNCGSWEPKNRVKEPV